jgi:hypothetical protein
MNLPEGLDVTEFRYNPTRRREFSYIFRDFNSDEVRISQRHSAGLRAGWSGVRVPTGAGNFSLHHRVQTGSGAHQASYPVGNRGSFPGVKRPGREADHSSLSSVEVNECVELIPPLLQCVFMEWCLVKNKKTVGTTLLLTFCLTYRMS